MKFYNGWAIRLGLTDFDKQMLDSGRSTFTGHGYLGVFGHTIPLAPDRDDPVVTVRLFKSRQKARNLLPEVRRGWPRAKIVRVWVEIKEVS